MYTASNDSHNSDDDDEIEAVRPSQITLPNLPPGCSTSAFRNSNQQSRTSFETHLPAGSDTRASSCCNSNQQSRSSFERHLPTGSDVRASNCSPNGQRNLETLCHKIESGHNIDLLTREGQRDMLLLIYRAVSSINQRVQHVETIVQNMGVRIQAAEMDTAPTSESGAVFKKIDSFDSYTNFQHRVEEEDGTFRRGVVSFLILFELAMNVYITFLLLGYGASA